MWFSRFLTISARVCVCHVNLRQFILDSHFAHINMHVNVNAIALVYVCIVRPIFFFPWKYFCSLNFFCHLLFLWYSIFCSARNFNCFSFSFIRCCSSSSGYITELLQRKQLETKKSRSLTRVLLLLNSFSLLFDPSHCSLHLNRCSSLVSVVQFENLHPAVYCSRRAQFYVLIVYYFAFQIDSISRKFVKIDDFCKTSTSSWIAFKSIRCVSFDHFWLQYTASNVISSIFFCLSKHSSLICRLLKRILLD